MRTESSYERLIVDCDVNSNKYRSRGTSSRSFRSRSGRASASEKVTDPNAPLYLDTFRNISGAELIKRSLECKIKAARTSLVGVDGEKIPARMGETRRRKTEDKCVYVVPERNELEFIMWRIITGRIIRVWSQKRPRDPHKSVLGSSPWKMRGNLGSFYSFFGDHRRFLIQPYLRQMALANRR